MDCGQRRGYRRSPFRAQLWLRPAKSPQVVAEHQQQSSGGAATAPAAPESSTKTTTDGGEIRGPVHSPALTGNDRFTVLIPFMPDSPNSPIPFDVNPDDPHSQFYSDLMMIAARPNEEPANSPPRQPRNFGDENEVDRFSARLMVFNLLEQIDYSRNGSYGMTFRAGEGVSPFNRPPVPFPQPAPYHPDAALLRAINESQFPDSLRIKTWTHVPVKLPEGIRIVISEQNEPGKPFLALVSLERPHFYKIDFSAQPSISMIVMNGTSALPAHFVAPANSLGIRTASVVVSMNYEIQQRQDQGFIPKEYETWAKSLFTWVREYTGY